MFQQGESETKSLLDFYPLQKIESFLAYFIRILDSCVIYQDSILLWRSGCVVLPCFNTQPDIWQLWIAVI